jgi:tetratricopeptide (TPR) repeat protein
MYLGKAMSSDDWYRNNKWNDEIEALFYEKLKRARSQRDQYIIIQASHLSESFPLISLQLIDEYFEKRKDKFDDVRAYWAQSIAFMNLGDIDKAMEAYRAILKREEEFPNHQTTAYVDYPYIVATKAIESEYQNVLSVLTKHHSRLMFPLDKFKWHASFALINNDYEQAVLALDVAKVKRSGFRFHQDVGLVGKEHVNVIKVLCKIGT